MSQNSLFSSVPTSVEAIDAAWLGAALSTNGNQVTVSDIRLERIVHGAGTKILMALDFAEGGSALPSRIWAKASWEPHGDIAHCAIREAIFYGEIAALARVPSPRSFYAAWDMPSDQGIVLIEDIGTRGGALWDCRTARSVDDVASLIEGLACLHAMHWESPRLNAMPFIDVPLRADGPGAAWSRANDVARIAAMLDTARGDAFPAEAKAPDRIDRAFWAMVDSLATIPIGCLLHGDPHPGNCFSDKDGQAGLYDWQTLSRGPWAHDVTYAIVTALTVEDRRSEERHLLKHYQECLRRNNVVNPPDDDRIWDEYRRHLAYSLHIWLTNHNTHQAEDVIIAMSARVGVAAADFDLFTLWGV